ncbi:MAG: dTDP-4-dehydrorhamnose reductase [Acutalibacteraceae bacterium]
MILVTGANGQLGSDVCKILKEQNSKFLPLDVHQLDITDRKKVDAFFKNNQIDSVIHCAAYTAVDKAEQDEEVCMNVNFTGTLNIAENCNQYDAKLIYISSDYVFPGDGTTPFETNDAKGPLNVYGKSKLLGEQAVIDNCKKFFIVRTSWVFGEKNTNFIHTMLQLSQSHEELNVVCDQVGSPTYSKHLAALLCEMVHTDKYGIYHATNEGFCSWAELAQTVFTLCGKTTKVNYVTTAQYGSKTNRPLNSRLSKKSLDNAGFKRLPDWQDAVKEYLLNLKEIEA